MIEFVHRPVEALRRGDSHCLLVEHLKTEKSGNVSAGEFILTVVGFGLLTLGGTFGGSIVYVHGMRVLNLVDEPAQKALSPLPHEEKEQAEG